jgi:NAD(P)-dependent dehydrogenase (short-subunit alcohol dehydrogenase family)
MDIKNSVAFVTGANRGIGRAFVEHLLERGVAKVYASARDVSKLAGLTTDPRVVAVSLDIGIADQVIDAAQKFTDVNVLINNAGIATFTGLIAAGDISEARAEMEINYFGTLNVTRAFAPVLAKNGGGAMVNLASIASYVNFPVLGGYSASKAAVHSLTQGVRAELAAQGTQVIGVYPGPIDTEMAEGFPMDKTPPQEVARSVVDAIIDGTEDVYPDPMSVEMHAGILGNPKAVEQQVGEMLPE